MGLRSGATWIFYSTRLETAAEESTSVRERIEARGRALITYFKECVRELPGVRLWTSMDLRMCGFLAAVSIREIPLQRIMQYLRERHAVITRPVEYDLNAVRFSTHYFNTFGKVDIALQGLREIAESRILDG